jgi:hypothetical protein
VEGRKFGRGRWVLRVEVRKDGGVKGLKFGEVEE